MIRPSPRTARFAGQFSLTLCCTLICCGAVLQKQAAQAAAPASESLLPDTTKGYVSVGDPAALDAAFGSSQWGQLAADPTLQPFVEDLRRQMKEKGVERLEKLGLNWDELKGVPGGEISLAAIQPGPGRMAIVVLVDVTGHKPQATALLEKINARLAAQGAERQSRDSDDPIVAFQLPKQEGESNARQAAYFLHNNLLAAADDPDVLRQILAAQEKPRSDSLAKLPAYRQIMQRCAKAAGPTAPHLRWFVEPFGYVEMVRSVSTAPRRHGIDLYRALKNQGFTAVQGIGGYVNFSSEGCELIHRTMVYAPPLPGHERSKEKYELAARMLKFPVVSDLEPENWVPQHVATYNSFNLDIQSAFAASETLVDEVMAEKGVFHDTLDSLKNDPQGPKVDVKKDFVDNLGSRITVVTDYQLPIGPKSERLLVAVESKNDKALSEALKKLMQGDAARRVFEGHVIWEVVDEDTAVPDLKIENSGAVKTADEDDAASAEGNTADGKKTKEDRDRIVPNAAMTVAYGHLFFASHIEFLKQALRQVDKHDGLAQCADFRFVSDRMGQLGAHEISFRLFSRTAEEYRPTYELIRTGRMPQAQTLFAQMLNALLGDGKDGVPRKQKIDGRMLPAFDTISHYFGPAGTYVTSETNGWLIVGCTLDNRLVPAAGNAEGVVRQPAATKPAKIVPLREAARKEPAPVRTENSAERKEPAAKGEATTATSPESHSVVAPAAVPVANPHAAPAPVNGADRAPTTKATPPSPPATRVGEKPSETAAK